MIALPFLPVPPAFARQHLEHLEALLRRSALEIALDLCPARLPLETLAMYQHRGRMNLMAWSPSYRKRSPTLWTGIGTLGMNSDTRLAMRRTTHLALPTVHGPISNGRRH